MGVQCLYVFQALNDEKQNPVQDFSSKQYSFLLNVCWAVIMDIVKEARILAEERYIAGKHCMFSVLRTKNDNVFRGAHVEAGNGRISLCAEAVAIGAAATAGDTEIAEIVTATESGDIVPPCGMCRELISDYSPNAKVILVRNGKQVHVPVLDLLPQKYKSEDFPNRRK